MRKKKYRWTLSESRWSRQKSRSLRPQKQHEPEFPSPACAGEGEKSAACLRCLLHFLFQQLGNDLVDHLIGQRPYLIRELRLDRVRHQDRLVLRHPQSSTLRMRCADELGGGDIGGRNPLLLKVDDIVRTARD